MVYEQYDFGRNSIVENQEFPSNLNVFAAVFQLWHVRSKNFWKRKSVIGRYAVRSVPRHSGTPVHSLATAQLERSIPGVHRNVNQENAIGMKSGSDPRL